MSEVPVMQDEIDRKAFESLVKLESDRNMGRITNAQASYGLDILWSSVSGLTKEDTMRILTSLKSEIKKDGSFLERSYYRHDSGAVVRLTRNDWGKIWMSMIRDSGTFDSEFDFSEEPNPCQSAKQKIISIEDALLKRGFLEI